jgi:protein-tyrosine phosphatase
MEFARNITMSVYNKCMTYTQSYINTTYEADEIIKGLYIGGLTSACNYEELKNRNINNVITVIYGAYELIPNNIEYKIIHAHDITSFNIMEYFDQTSDFIDNKLSCGENVLVHCMCGISRSSTIVIAYLIKKKGYSLEYAMEFVKSKRNCINPNIGFVKQLKEYEQLCHNIIGSV